MTLRRWNVLIADDEPAARRGVRQLLAPFAGFTVAGECRNGSEVLAALASTPVDAMFLDVQMPGIDGFEVIERRSKHPLPAVVFLTAYDQFAVRAFEAQAIDYLLKPVSVARFASTIDRLTRHLKTVADVASVPNIIVTTARGSRVVALSEIEWIEAADNYSRVWVEGRDHLIRRSLQDLEQAVTAHGFVRAHRCALVPVRRIQELKMTNDRGLVAVLSGGAVIPISRRRRSAFTRLLRSRGLQPGSVTR
jgi:two-component system, LytTR family, response regulator